MKAEQPRNLGYMQLAVIEVSNRQVTSQLLKYFSEVQPFVRKLSCKRPLAHSQAGVMITWGSTVGFLQLGLILMPSCS